MKKILLSLACLFFSLNLLAFDSINMMTLNTWMIPFLRKDSIPRAQIIGNEINNHDLVFLQEAFNKRLRGVISKNTNGTFEDSYVPETSVKINSGLYVFSSYKILNRSFLAYKDCGGLQCLSKKGIQHLRLELPSGQQLDIFNTHLQAYQKDAAIRVGQLKEAVAFINRINDGTLPVLFAGDFNVISEISEYDVLTSHLAPFVDVWNLVNPGMPGHTWNPFVNYYATKDDEESTYIQRIDYIFIRNGREAQWKAQSADVILDSPMPYKIKGQTLETFASDHFGVTATLELH